MFIKRGESSVMDSSPQSFRVIRAFNALDGNGPLPAPPALEVS